MSRNIILSLATAATIVVAGLAAGSADARGIGGAFGGARGHFGAGHFGGRGGGLAMVGRGGIGRGGIGRGGIGRGGRFHPGGPVFAKDHHHHHHHHWVFRGGRWIDVDIDGVYGDDAVVDTAPVAAAPAPGPCTCLVKDYTPDGLVVFTDMCTKESASAPVDGRASNATDLPTSTNYAGRTYEDYLAANPQASAPAPQKN